MNGSGSVDMNSFFELFRLADMQTNYNLSASLSSSLADTNTQQHSPLRLTPLVSPPLPPAVQSRKYSLSPLLSPTISPIPVPVSRTFEKQESLNIALPDTHRGSMDKTRSRSLSSLPLASPSPKVHKTALQPIITVDNPSMRHARLRSLSTQQQTVISAQGEAVFVLRNSLDSSNHGNSRKNSLDNSNHGFNAPKNSLDYSFHGNDFLPDDLPEDGQIPVKSPRVPKVFFS